jgi:hypothetical protein
MPLGRHRALWLAFVVSATVVAVRELEYFAVAYDRFHLPAFDGHVYVAMAERPGFFTVAPWGYRVLNPWLVRLLTLTRPDVVPGFFWSTVLGLTGGGVLLFFYLRRLGHAVLPALLGLTLFGVSGPVGEVVRYQFLAEPLTFLFEMAFLLALHARAPLAATALLALLGVLSKEFFLLLLPLVYLADRGVVGRGRALAHSILVALPAVSVTLALRLYWTPHIESPIPALAPETLTLALDRFRESWPLWRGTALLAGLAPLAVLGAFREGGRALAPAGAYLFLVTLLSPFLNPVTFLSTDIDRLLIYALPAVVPLALVGLGGLLLPRTAASAPPWAPPRPAVRALGPALGLAAMTPFLVVDRYERIDLQGRRDATVVLAVLRETIDTAELLDAGETFRFDPADGRFSRGLTTPFDLSQLRHVRFFLLDGWGPWAARGGGEPVLRERTASLLLPCLTPHDLRGRLTLEASRETRLGLRINGRPVADLLVGPSAGDHGFRVPREALRRGDNVLTLVRAGADHPQVRLLGFGFKRS